jgi:transposase
MNTQLTDQTPAAAHDDPVRCFVAIELSKKNWQIAVLMPPCDKISIHTLPAGDGAALLARLDKLRCRAERELGRCVEIVSCYEAGYDGFWLHRLLTEHGITNHVLDPASVQVNRRARRAKTDRIDLYGLLRALMAYLRGEPKVVSVVRVPSVAEEDAKQLHRERKDLVDERNRHSNRIKGWCATQGIYDYDPVRASRHDWLKSLRTGDGRDLPVRLRAAIEHELQRLELVLEMIAKVEKERDAIAAAKSPAHPQAGKITTLARLKGIGPEFATVLTGEVFYRSFDNRRQLASYVGLVSSPFASGRLNRDQGISKAGNSLARTTMVELAWMWLRHQPDSALTLWFRNRVGTLKGRPRRIAIVALARKLLIALWRYVETGLVPTGAVLKA